MVVGKMRGSSEFQRLLDRERSPFASMVERTIVVSFPQNLSEQDAAKKIQKYFRNYGRKARTP
jgi:hypothetical protein